MSTNVVNKLHVRCTMYMYIVISALDLGRGPWGPGPRPPTRRSLPPGLKIYMYMHVVMESRQIGH